MLLLNYMKSIMDISFSLLSLAIFGMVHLIDRFKVNIYDNPPLFLKSLSKYLCYTSFDRSIPSKCLSARAPSMLKCRLLQQSMKWKALEYSHYNSYFNLAVFVSYSPGGQEMVTEMS